MLSLEVVGPGDSLSTLLMRCLPGGTPVGEGPGSGNSDGSIQLRPLVGGACLLAAGGLAAVTVEQLRFSTATESKICDSCSFVFGLIFNFWIHIQPFSYQKSLKLVFVFVFVIRIHIRPFHILNRQMSYYSALFRLANYSAYSKLICIVSFYSLHCPHFLWL